MCPICGMSEGVVQVFLTAPGFMSGKTKFVDKKFDQLAVSYGLSNMSNRDGEPVSKASTELRWGGSGSGAVMEFKNAGLQPGNALEPLKKGLPSLDAMTSKTYSKE